MITKSMTEMDDLELVSRSRAGDLDAFGTLVGRYQSLVCSLAYSATGSLAQSEDLAQETFVTAWRQLPNLREPARLRSWLCGIARNLIHNWLRKEGRQPTRAAEPLEKLAGRPAPEPVPAEQAISNEEAALLWRSLERIPESYREPLVLFYRERQSIQSVATALELSEDAVKQRLSRGRKLLQEEVAAFVESTLTRSAPGRAFTIGVIAALPTFAVSASAATVAGAAAKGGAAAAWSSILTWATYLSGPLIGLAGAWFGLKAGLNSTRTPRERRYIITQAKKVIVAAVLFNIALFAHIWFVMPRFREHPVIYAVISLAIPVLFGIYITVGAFRQNKQFARLRMEERKAHPELFPAAELANPIHEYKSRWSLFGLPLVHIRSGAVPGENRKPAIGWIALGDTAYGILFAGGGFAVGGIAMGGISVGVIALGGATAGGLALGGLALGGLAFGGAAIGWMSVGGFALGYLSATGGLAIAHDFAIGGQAIANHANDAIARAFFQRHPWLDVRQDMVRNAGTWLTWLPLLCVIPFLRRRRRS